MTARRAGRLAWSLCALSVVLGVLGVWFARLNPRAGVSLQEQIGLLTTVMAFAAVGSLIVSRRAGNVIGWIYCAAGVAFVLDSFTVQYARYALFTHAGGLAGGVVAGWVKNWVLFPALGLVGTYALLLFPDGRLPSRRWRPIAWLAGFGIAATVVGNALWPKLLLDPSGDGSGADPALIPANPLGVASAEGFLSLLFAVGGIALIAATFLSAASVAVRFRHGRGNERLQLKWLIFAAAVIVVAYATLNLFPESQLATFAGDFFLVLLLLIPAATGIAILRYHLYDIDRIISRTVSYALLTGLLAAVYLGVVFALQGLLRSIAGESQLAMAGATLAVAALFGPLRRRLQTAVDRRFNRARYDAQRTVDEFRARLRDEVDLQQLGAELVGAVRSTVEPAEVSLWLRPREAATNS